MLRGVARKMASAMSCGEPPPQGIRLRAAATSGGLSDALEHLSLILNSGTLNQGPFSACIDALTAEFFPSAMDAGGGPATSSGWRETDSSVMSTGKSC
jgi:hypothetical protein